MIQNGSICSKCKPGFFLNNYYDQTNGALKSSCDSSCQPGFLPFIPSYYYLNQKFTDASQIEPSDIVPTPIVNSNLAVAID